MNLGNRISKLKMADSKDNMLYNSDYVKCLGIVDL